MMSTFKKEASYQLILDMSRYCQTAKQYRIACEHSPDSALRAKERFLAEKKAFEPYYTELGASLLWKKIQAKLAAHCRESAPILFTALSHSYNQPLVLDVLSAYFRELIKNSMDALLEHFLQSGSQTTLSITIMAAIDDNHQLAIDYIDNAGGFSASYLNSFSEYVAAKHYRTLPAVSISKKRDDTLYLGGAGQGLRLLMCLLLDGDNLLHRKKIERVYHRVTNTSIEIKNNIEMNGAHTRMVSPIQPFKPFSHGVRSSSGAVHARIQRDKPSEVQLKLPSFFPGKIRKVRPKRECDHYEQAGQAYKKQCTHHRYPLQQLPDASVDTGREIGKFTL